MTDAPSQLPFETIVVGTDGSRDAEAAVRVAARIGASGATIHVVTAFNPPSDSELGRLIASLPRELREGHDPTTRSQEVLRAGSAVVAGAGVSFVDHLVDADAAAAILDVADTVAADLVVVGCRGLAEGDRFGRGSVSDRVVGSATCSVLVVRE